MTTDDFAPPAPPAGKTDWKTLKGSLMLFTVNGQEVGVKTTYGDADPIRADIAILDGPQAGDVIEDSLIFPKVLISQLKPRIGGKVLGRLGQGSAKPGQDPPWQIEEATDADKTLARDWLAKNAPPPF